MLRFSYVRHRAAVRRAAMMCDMGRFTEWNGPKRGTKRPIPHAETACFATHCQPVRYAARHAACRSMALWPRKTMAAHCRCGRDECSKKGKCRQNAQKMHGMFVFVS